MTQSKANCQTALQLKEHPQSYQTKTKKEKATLLGAFWVGNAASQAEQEDMAGWTWSMR